MIDPRLARAKPTAMLLLIVALAGCGSSVDTAPMQSQADRLYELARDGRTGEMLDLYSVEFYEFVERDEWEQALTEIYAELGAYRRHEFIDSIITASVREGSTVTLFYEVDYAKHRVIEQLTYRDADVPQLIRHQFNTDADLPDRHARTEASDADG